MIKNALDDLALLSTQPVREESVRIGFSEQNLALSAQSYFDTLANRYLNMLITDHQGELLLFEEGFDRAIQMLLCVRESGKKVMLIGNGGSAAIANHTQTDLSNSLKIKAITFYDSSLLTAFSNDFGYPAAFEKFTQLWAEPGDLLVAISSSGKSENILRSVREAQKRECSVITLSGFQPENPLRTSGDLNFYVDSMAYGHVETAHSILAHSLTDLASQRSLYNEIYPENLGDI